MKKKKFPLVLIIALLAVTVITAVFGIDRTSAIYAYPSTDSIYYYDDYQSYLDNNGYDGTLASDEAAVNLMDYTVSNGMETQIGEEGLITGDTGAITWSFQVQETGFYNLEMGYIAQPGTTSDMQRRLKVNDEFCYSGLEQIVLKRFWADEPIKSRNGNEIRPSTNETYKEEKVYIDDYKKRISEPYLFYLEKGKNTITLEVIKEPVEYTSLVFKKAEQPKSYAQSMKELANTYEIYGEDTIICQAERTEGGTLSIEKNSSAINIQKNYSDSLLIPYHPYKILYNTIGADSYKQPGDAITWEIAAPKEGLYEITFKGRQSLKRGVTAYRRLRINGEIPYNEMKAVGFSYSSQMTNYTIADEKGEPYLFYLKKGSNYITLESVMGDFGGIISEVEKSMYRLNQTYLQVVRITGTAPDKFIDYEIGKKIPEFKTVMSEEGERLLELVDKLVAITGEKGENTSLLEKMAIQALGLAEKPDSVTDEIAQLKNNISALGTWLVKISEMPLELDSIMLSGKNTELPKAEESTLQGMYYGTLRFLSTFFVKQSTFSEGDDADDTITVWMVAAAPAAGQTSSGREQAQIVQNLIDEVYTPDSGVTVKLQLIPVDVVLRAALAGNSPDVVIGLNQATLQDFAMRNAISCLSDREDFVSVTERFYKNTLDSASYQGKVYGLPEQVNFMMLFYRKDILEQIGARVPKTWEEVRELLPVLQKNNYGFYLPTVKSGPNVITSFIYQKGGELYKGTGNNYGISSALEQEEAMSAFKEYTDLFTGYGLEVQVDFPNRFRTGTMPIGITNYTTYNQLEIFAPEIKGLWTFAPIPGTLKEDGTIDNTYVADTVQSTILKSSKNQEESWDFIKWWTSTKIQLNYANTVESVMGTAARYAAADPEVLKQLPWSNTEMLQLTKQLEATVGIPAIPGHYMTTRMVQYAFDKVVAELANPRETLYMNVKAIDKELAKKREEFHLTTSEE